jgi:hypothetical protein
MSTKPRKFPEHDQKRDGSPFPWIIKVAAQIRAERQAERVVQRVKVREAGLRWVPREPDEH